MASSADHFLNKTLGEDFMESLQKVELWKPGTKSTIDHEEIRTALQIVPRTVMAMLIRELSPMNIGETKEVELFVASSAKMTVSKHERDVYSGEIFQDNKKVVEFKLRALPGVGLIIMSAFELYDMENLINTPVTKDPLVEDAGDKVQKLIDERLALHDLIERVAEKRVAQRDAVHSMILMRLTEELQKEKENNKKIAQLSDMARTTAPMSEEYFRGMANGVEVANATANNKEPNFVDPQPKPGEPGYSDSFSERVKKSMEKKKRPLTEFLEKKAKKKEYAVVMAKGETVSCPDCRQSVFDGSNLSGCICLGDDMQRKVFLKKTEDGIKVRFSKGWDAENIEMLLEVLRRKNG